MKQIKKKHQKGLGLIGLFGGAFLITFFAVIVITLAPTYFENFSVRSCLTSLAEDSVVLQKNEAAIKSALMKKLEVSNVRHVSPNDISIEKSKAGIKINIAYNVQAKFIKNVDFIVSFDEVKEVRL